jgi:UDP-N-acetylglucosamine diphosphorylase/glucosamine-1-phosphate N-acetyltransferase
MYIFLFEDDLVPRLSPVSLSRPAYAITCGGWRLVDLVKALGTKIGGSVRPHLEPFQSDYDVDSPAIIPDDESCLFVNARLVPSLEAWQILQTLIGQKTATIIHHRGQVAAALLTSGPLLSSATQLASAPLLTSGRQAVTGKNSDNIQTYLIQTYLSDLQQDESIAIHSQELPLLDWPHDVVRYHLELLGSWLEHRLSTGQFKQLSDGVYVGDNVVIGDHVVFDTSQGPILIEDLAQIGPLAYLEGPVQIGTQAHVLHHAEIKKAVTIGHDSKIGGEVLASIIEPYSNKQHHGFLGHSYVGSWVNFGAGSCNSNLKNTYGEISMQYGDERVATGTQFLGVIAGDYVKSAINTSIFTGKTIGCCSTLYGFVTENVGAFVNHAKSLGSVTEMSVETVSKSQSKMFARRGIGQRDCDRQLIKDMHGLTRQQRHGLTSEPPSF